MTTRTLSRSFAGGEITPELFGRIDLDKMQTGLKKCRNMIIKPHGPAKSRGGFRFLNFCKYNDRKARLIRFQFSTEDSMIVELGHEYARFHTNNGTEVDAIVYKITSVTNDSGVRVLVTLDPSTPMPATTGMTVFINDTLDSSIDGRFFNIEYLTPTTFYLMDRLGHYIAPSSIAGLPVTPTYGKTRKVLEVVTPYDEADLFGIRFTQSLDVLTFTHPDYPPATLSRMLDTLGAVTWEYEVINFDPDAILEIPTGMSSSLAGATHPSPSRYSYVVTSVSDDGHEESLPSTPNKGAANAATNKIMQIDQWQALYDGGSPVIASPTEDEADHAIFMLASYNLDEGEEVVLTDMPTGWDDLNDSAFTVSTIVDAGTDRYTLFDSTGEPVRTSGRPVFATAPSYCREAGIRADLSHEGNAVRLKWTRVAGINRYNVYKRQGTSYFYGYIGQSKSPRFTDKNIVADLTKSPPEAVNYFETDYPAAVTYFDQRKVFAGTRARPQTAWLTRPYTESNVSSSFPVKPDDSIMVTAKTNEASTILHAVSLNDIVLLTSGGEIRIRSDGDALTPTTVSARAQSYIGAASVQPVMSNRAAIFVENGGNALRELLYKGDIENSYESQNISIMSPHLFESPVTDMAFMRGVDPVVWAVREDGVLVGATYVPEQRVIAYHQHDTNGEIESVATAYSNSAAVAVVDAGGEIAAEIVPENYLAASESLFAAMDVAPDIADKTAIDNAIRGLVDAGYWDRMDALFVSKMANNQQAACIDWKRLIEATIHGSATWAQANGFVGSVAAGSYINTLFTPSSDAVSFTANSGGYGFYLTAIPTTNSALMGGYGPLPASKNRSMLYFSNTVHADCFDNCAISGDGSSLDVIPTTAANTCTAGVVQINRSSRSSQELFMNGVSLGTSSYSIAGRSLSDQSVMILAESNNSGAAQHSSDCKIGAWWAGDKFNATEQDDIRSILDTYFAAMV